MAPSTSALRTTSEDYLRTEAFASIMRLVGTYDFELKAEWIIYNIHSLDADELRAKTKE